MLIILFSTFLGMFEIFQIKKPRNVVERLNCIPLCFSAICLRYVRVSTHCTFARVQGQLLCVGKWHWGGWRLGG